MPLPLNLIKSCLYRYCSAWNRSLHKYVDIIRVSWQSIFGYDFFVSYAWSDGRPYAEGLLNILSDSANRYRCFIDTKEMGGGEIWRHAVEMALRRSKVFVLVGSQGALESDNVFLEVRTFCSRGLPLLPIDFENRISLMSGKHRLHPYLEARIRISEECGKIALKSGEPSNDVIIFINNSFHFVRIARIRQLVLTMLTAIFCMISLIALTSFLGEREQRQLAVARLAATEVSPNYSLDLSEQAAGAT